MELVTPPTNVPTSGELKSEVNLLPESERSPPAKEAAQQNRGHRPWNWYYAAVASITIDNPNTSTMAMLLHPQTATASPPLYSHSYGAAR
ncbi:hypothetical protein Nepgr_025583 [Nepenthes gracilis]|uniref:Uncharacterized protein n=1 Tax=Nepenthes gracilis TaxID=150966 RepID=A0AAD3T6B7_NEPGR|nr:hypothetical protein Nepgr_025583 [Nepenthes gracilis]